MHDRTDDGTELKLRQKKAMTNWNENAIAIGHGWPGTIYCYLFGNKKFKGSDFFAKNRNKCTERILLYKNIYRHNEMLRQEK